MELINISKKFNHKQILNNINFKFNTGFYLITGESGIGKTTLLNIISGYLKADTGKIKYNSKINMEYLFQEDLLFSNLTVKENMLIKYIANEKNDLNNFEEVCTSILLKLKIKNLWNEKINRLSGGEKQRIQLANILIKNPDIILMDEPISKLDKKNRYDVINLIKDIFKNKIVIIISHNEIISGFTNLKIMKGKLIINE